MKQKNGLPGKQKSGIMTVEQKLFRKIMKLQKKLDHRINSREDLQKNMKISRKLDELISEYQNMT